MSFLGANRSWQPSLAHRAGYIPIRQISESLSAGIYSAIPGPQRLDLCVCAYKPAF